MNRPNKLSLLLIYFTLISDLIASKEKSLADLLFRRWFIGMVGFQDEPFFPPQTTPPPSDVTAAV
jgi:hypothetical protein